MTTPNPTLQQSKFPLRTVYVTKDPTGKGGWEVIQDQFRYIDHPKEKQTQSLEGEYTYCATQFLTGPLSVSGPTAIAACPAAAAVADMSIFDVNCDDVNSNDADTDEEYSGPTSKVDVDFRSHFGSKHSNVLHMIKHNCSCRHRKLKCGVCGMKISNSEREQHVQHHIDEWRKTPSVKIEDVSFEDASFSKTPECR